MRNSRLHIPKLDFTGQIALWGGICVLIFLAAAVFAWVQLREQGLETAHHDMDQSLANFETRLDERSIDLEDLAKWLIGQPEFTSLLAAGPSVDLTQYLSRIVKANMVDAVTVTDSEGNVLARVSKDQPSATGGSILLEPGIRNGAAGVTSLGIRSDQFDNVVQSVVFSIRRSEQDSPIGVLRLGFYLDSGFVNRASVATNSQMSYYYTDGSTLTLMGDPQREQLLTSPLPAAVLAALREGRQSDAMTLDTVNGPYLFKFSPFRSLDPNLVAAYGVGLPTSEVKGGNEGLFQVMEATALALAILTCVAAYLLRRRYALPLRNLGRAAERMTGGDLTDAAALRDGDLDGLGGQLNAMRRHLKESVESATLEMNRKTAIIQALGAAVIVTDDSNLIVELNPVAKSLLDGAEGTVDRLDWRQVFEESKRPNEGTGLFRKADGKGPAQGFASPIHGRYSLRRDPRVTLDVISKPLGLDGRVSGYVHILHDASEQEQFVRARDDFMMNVAHELRSPLASLRTAVETMEEEQLLMSKQEMSIMLRSMRRAVLRFEAFVENLIDMGSVVAGQFVVRPIPCPLDEIIQNALSQVASLLEAKGQSVTVRSNCPVPCKVFADPARITQVMVNLLTNAAKYGPENEPIVFWVCDNERSVSIDVSDRGKGIPPEEQSKVFQRFYRGKRGRVEGNGLGLGLALAKEIVEAHGGKIGIKSQEGEGTTFWFSLLKTP